MSYDFAAPKLLLPTFHLPNALPGTAQWISPFPQGTNGVTFITLLQFASSGISSYTVHLVAPGASAVTSNRLFIARGMAANSNEVWQYDQFAFCVPAAWSIFAFAATATAITMTMSGWEAG